MSYRKKAQHNYIKPIKQREIERGVLIDENSIDAFVLTVGGTASVEKTLTQNPKSISVVNIGSVEIKFSLTAASSTSGADFVMFNSILLPAYTTLFLEGDEIALISKATEGYNYTFTIAAASGTPSANIFIRT